jgi:hypothetical protein
MGCHFLESREPVIAFREVAWRAFAKRKKSGGRRVAGARQKIGDFIQNRRIVNGRRQGES